MSKDLKPLFTSADSGQYDERFFNVLFDAMNAADQQGFDYLEFKQALNSLKAVHMDEATRFKSAFAMANTMGLTAQKLEVSIQHYIQTLNKEERNFEQVVERQMSLQVHEKENELININKEIETLHNEIEAIQQRIRVLQGNASEITDSISQAADKIMATKNDFHRTMDYIVQQMQQDLSAIKSYLS